MKQQTIAIALAASTLASGCATIARGTTDTVHVAANVPGATVTTDHGYHGTVPAVIEARRKDTFTVTVSADGYRPQSVFVDNKISGKGGLGMAGNALIGGVIGVGIDAVSGAAMDHYPVDIYVTLERMEPEKTASGSE
ncbi:MAG TPA: PEGA domain-containing protein [Gammaproteobacteria bacterium]|nr:PEGA domain-containing protein [Gammaproteobacteria bacterium]